MYMKDNVYDSMIQNTTTIMIISIIIPLHFFMKRNIRIGSVHASVPCQISETAGWIYLILGVMKDAPLILEF